MTTAAIAATATSPALRRIRDGYWRVTASSGIVLGYVEEVAAAAEPRFVAKRLVPSTTRVVAIGEFWHREEAAECLR